MNPYWWKLLNFAVDRLFGPRVNALRTAEFLAPARNIVDTVWASPRLNLLAVSPAICDPKPDWPDFHHVCGFFAIPEQAEQWTMPDDLKKFLDAGPAPVYMTVGSMLSLDISPKEITELMMKAALLAGCRAIIQSCWDGLTDLPDHRDIYKIRKAPHRHIFPYCSAVVHHGGSGTTHSATLNGCPSIVVQHGLDQAVFARELHRLGAAPKALDRKSVTAKKLARAMRSVLDVPAFKTRVEELGAIIKAERGLDRACERIEERFAAGTT
jgi:UDP:flavonoid glycosyltransferase YjiC (YdhE family)